MTKLALFLGFMMLLTAALQSGFSGFNWTPIVAAQKAVGR
jgi:hypothetical protein